MALRTPRRRISPRTKRRYRAIKNFLWRALGNSSQHNIKINSSIVINVTDLKHKIVGLEQKLNKVSKQLICVENNSTKGSDLSIPEIRDNNIMTETFQEQTDASSERKSKRIETKILYKTSESQYRKSDDSDCIPNNYNLNNIDVITSKIAEDGKYHKSKPKNNKSKITNKTNVIKECQLNMLQQKTRSVYENVASAYSTSSYHSLIEPKFERYLYNEHQNKKYNRKYGRQREASESVIHDVPKKIKEHIRRIKPERPTYISGDIIHEKRQRDKHIANEVDQDFIADIIRKQYKPTRIFDKRESDITQFSAPVCRDQEFHVQENILEGSKLCSCCCDDYKRAKYVHENEFSDMRSICDTRLYSSKRNTRHKSHRRHTNNYNYNDSRFYDLIPVKENSSPKSKRKFSENINIPYHQYYKEVPPSPRTHRPQLNLKAQYFMEVDDEASYIKRKNRRRRQDYGDTPDRLDSNRSLAVINIQKQQNKHQIQQGNDAMNSLQTPTSNDAQGNGSLQTPISNNEQNNCITNGISLNKTQETDLSADKTDKALCEIKDVLQTFLQEIKKETISQCGKSEISNKSEEKVLSDFQNRSKINGSNNSQIGINNYSMPPCSLPPALPFVPAFTSTNPCCYPLLPICPMNCIQSSYIMPSPSYTCANCAHNKEEVHENNQNTTNNTFNTTNNETDHLIKEIYNFVMQNPENNRKKDDNDRSGKSLKENTTAKILTSRSDSGSSKVSKHDVKIGTPKIKCYSKSCEAIVSPHLDTYFQRNPSYSDTILEKLSLEATATEIASETELNSDPTTTKKPKGNKFAQVLRSFGFFKKKKEDVIEELSESESTIEVDVKKKSPYRQELTNYMMHGQEYFHQPPIPPINQPHQNSHCHHHGNNYPNCYSPHDSGYPSPRQNLYNIHCPRKDQHGNIPAHSNHVPQRPIAPHYPNAFNNYNQVHPQIPLCLKEIEVKSIATQSERKMSFFKKFTKKMQPPTTRSNEYPQKNYYTQTAKEKPIMFNWKNLQAKQTVPFNNDPLKLSHKTQKQLADGDINMRNAIMKKLFYKRNPFSPRNLIIRTLLGKDKSSFGEPPKMYRPRMFF
ncbi:uncharacterized protein LOC113510901 [Galleria mellonella]|uniref:Uncharacterized protein LOC113510901 n=1 Tax=Galleria mellonella TaxID=7137 RepID=A0A6J1WIA9_GALME|nr:uncharacterized protein LOC113510901 [Galleria mellonella]